MGYASSLRRSVRRVLVFLGIDHNLDVFGDCILKVEVFEELSDEFGDFKPFGRNHESSVCPYVLVKDHSHSELVDGNASGADVGFERCDAPEVINDGCILTVTLCLEFADGLHFSVSPLDEAVVRNDAPENGSANRHMVLERDGLEGV
ncbi:MAG: hypothetical protein BWY82_01896 [Verrucomicrobia bacterium ADurb.Bin474]|nr:MAG: hypothetical protein BWY82_01896 [Verrucomicrobia bacterium ADurb.Bin474]